MKKIYLYFLTVLIIMYTTGMYELVKLPVLFRHYTEHKQAATTRGIIDFLAMHYLGNDKKDNDDAKDNQLPFKNYTVKLHPNLLFIPVQEYSISIIAFYFEPKIILYPPDIAPETNANISFRPPCCS